MFLLFRLRAVTVRLLGRGTGFDDSGLRCVAIDMLNVVGRGDEALYCWLTCGASGYRLSDVVALRFEQQP